MSKTKTLYARPKASRSSSVLARLEHAPSAELPDEAALRAMIADAAYYRARDRGFEPGHELEDWLTAEAEIVSSSLRLQARPGAH